MVNPAQTIDFDTTIAALQQDPTSIPANDAIAIIDAWQQELAGHDISEDLGELKQAIQDGDASEIAEILADLGEDTSDIAADLPEEIAAKVQQIGQLLSQLAQEAE